MTYTAVEVKIYVEVDGVSSVEAKQIVEDALDVPTTYSTGDARVIFHTPLVRVSYVGESSAQDRENHTAETARLNRKYQTK